MPLFKPNKNQLYNPDGREIVSFQLILFHVWCRAINFTCIMMIDNDWLFLIQSDYYMPMCVVYARVRQYL